MAGLGRKVFTAGDVLTASDVQNYLMDQTVMNFAGTAARSSAIATPTTGMTTYIGTTGTATIPQLETYTGSAWQTPYGATLLNTTTFTAAASIAVDNVFTSAYDYYVIQFSGSCTSTVNLRAVYRTSAGADVVTNYTTGSIYTNAAAGPSRASAVGGLLYILPAIGPIGSSFTINIKDVATTKVTTSDFTSFAAFSTELETAVGGCINTNTTAYAGFKFYVAAGTLTGTFKIYGYRNS